MSYETELSDITNYFNTGWGNTTQVAWPNVQFDPQDLDEWVTLTILNGDAVQGSAGSSVNLHRHFGTIVHQIFVEPNSGAKRARELADMICDIWRGIYLNNLLFRTPNVTVIGIADGRYQINVSCAFQRDSFH